MRVPSVITMCTIITRRKYGERDVKNIHAHSMALLLSFVRPANGLLIDSLDSRFLIENHRNTWNPPIDLLKRPRVVQTDPTITIFFFILSKNLCKCILFIIKGIVKLLEK